MSITNKIVTRTVLNGGYHRLLDLVMYDACLIKKVLIGIFDEHDSERFSGPRLSQVIDESVIFISIQNRDVAGAALFSFGIENGWFSMPINPRSLVVLPAALVVVDMRIEGWIKESFTVRTCLIKKNCTDISAPEETPLVVRGDPEVNVSDTVETVEMQGKTGLMDVPEAKPKRIIYCQGDWD